ncbi:SMC family ATPase [Deinococcus radiomollis]|uniref:AAA family ATPase n=1 Tax=Deinococcus radiomollis TaxID=468916 RepID=UPI003891532F
MKPVRLTVQGFMAFRLHQQVDFTGLDLFAIVGPTGSGKSALLDAMTFALFGATPRLGLSGMEALISQNEQGASVSLEFEVRGQLHKVARTRGRKASQNQVVLETWDAASERWSTQAKGKVAETNERIVEVLGLDFAAFTRAVLLPQGEFSAFLKGKSSDRQKLLGDLLNLGEVAQMATFARERTKGYSAQLDGIHRLLTGEYEGISAEVLTGWQAEQAAADTRSEALAEAREELNTTLQRLRELGKLSEAHGRARAALHTHEAQTEGVRRGAVQASAARRVAGVLPLIGSAQRGAEAAQRAAGAAAVQAEARATAGRGSEAAGVRLNVAQAAADRLPEHEERAQMLREAEALAVRLRLVGGRVDAAHAQPLPWNEEAHAQAAAAAERLKKNALERVKLEAERAALERRKLDLQAEEALQKRELAELERVTETGMKARSDLDALKAEQGVAQSRAGILAHVHLLHLGEPCPLCEQPVTVLPQSEPSGEAAKLTLLNTRVQGQEAVLDSLRLKLSDLRVSTKTRNTTLQGAAEKLREEESHLVSRETDLYAAEEALKSALTGDPLMGDPADLAARYLAGLAGQLRLVGRNPAADRQKLLAQMAEIRRAHDEARTLQAQADSAQAAAAAAYASALTQVAEREAEAQQATETLAAALAALGLSAEQASAAALPEAEIVRLEAAAAQHEQTRQRLSAELGELERKLGAQSFDPSRLSAAERDLAGLDAEIRSAQQASGQLAQKLLAGRERLARKETLIAEAAEVARSLDTWKTLSGALGVSAFQQYLLQEVESRLLQGAGQLLLDISDGRYRLALEDGDYVVQDLWNAGETRAVRTLSGGETFLASLALAIALSDYLAGNQILGALFLDEGFGTLDPQALEAVAGALENLRTGGRMVGVITHIESLSDRLPHHLLVSKSAAGSSVQRLQ